jgi:hypothetical protein
VNRNDHYNPIDLPVEGYYDKTSQFWILIKKDEWHIDSERNFMVVGGPGVDGIEFGIRKGLEGIWAYYPIDDEYIKVTKSADELIEGWNSGKIKV